MKSDEIGRVYVVILKSKEKTCNFFWGHFWARTKINIICVAREKEGEG